MVALFRRERGAYRDAVILNAAAALHIAGSAENVMEGARIATETIESGRALHLLKRLQELAGEAA
jgi:anthranilate phosphoribosyltransferase